MTGPPTIRPPLSELMPPAVTSPTRRSLSELLQCPVCAARLESPEGCGDCATAFPVADALPVLIAFEDSIFTRADYNSAAQAISPRVRTAGRLAHAIKRVIFGSNDEAARNIAEFLARVDGQPPRILVVGGGTIGAGLEELYSRTDVDLVGVDVYPSPHIDLICDGHRLPFIDECFDGVIVQAVLEHVVDPARVVAEIHRTLRGGGMVYAETPFMQQVHEGAYDFTRFTLSGHRWLFREFDEIDAGQVLGPGTASLWSMKHLMRSLGLSKTIAAAMLLPFFWLRLLDRVARRGGALDGACGLYFLGTKSTQPMKANALPAYFLAHR